MYFVFSATVLIRALYPSPSQIFGHLRRIYPRDAGNWSCKVFTRLKPNLNELTHLSKISECQISQNDGPSGHCGV